MMNAEEHPDPIERCIQRLTADAIRSHEARRAEIGVRLAELEREIPAAYRDMKRKRNEMAKNERQIAQLRAEIARSKRALMDETSGIRLDASSAKEDSVNP